MPTLLSRLHRFSRDPLAAPAAIVRLIKPDFASGWVRAPGDAVTFRERGFVAAPSPAMLLARHNYEVARIQREIGQLHRARSLEIGCGFGRLSTTLAQFADRHDAIDINATALGLAHDAYPGVHFTQGSATAIPFADATFDLVVTWTVLQHVPPESLAAAGSEIGRVLAPGGALLICEETRLADAPTSARAHTWHRHVAEYEALFPQLDLQAEGYISEIDRIHGLDSPGNVMRFG